MRAVAVDCADPVALADFWVRVAGAETVFSSPQFVALNAGGMWVTLVRVAEYAPPTWPDGDRPKQFHFDLSVDDLDAAEAEAVALGAVKAAEQPAPDRWRVFLDPAGHPFCLSTQIPD
ncbi:VOC family protein [Actinocatenispora rupis]